MPGGLGYLCCAYNDRALHSPQLKHALAYDKEKENMKVAITWKYQEVRSFDFLKKNYCGKNT